MEIIIPKKSKFMRVSCLYGTQDHKISFYDKNKKIITGGIFESKIEIGDTVIFNQKFFPTRDRKEYVVSKIRSTSNNGDDILIKIQLNGVEMYMEYSPDFFITIKKHNK